VALVTGAARGIGAAFAGRQPVGRLLDPGEIAAVPAFLAGLSSSAMTRAVVPADGGLAL
jgi:NAD(P)-dependent dehydrogenase (short-subunit alcohol dehydrogenase family)